MEMIHHGGKHMVTGSCHELRDSGQAVLIDCGLFQGKEVQGKDTRPLDIDFETSHLNAQLLTHSHRPYRATTLVARHWLQPTDLLHSSNR